MTRPTERPVDPVLNAPDTAPAHGDPDGVESRAMCAGRRRILEQALIESVAAVLIPAAALTATTGVLDYHLWLPPAGVTTAGLVLTLAALVVRARRYRRHPPTRLTHYGIRQGPHITDVIAWPFVASVTSTRHPLTGRRIQVRLHDGRTIVLVRPRGACWLPDPAFDENVTTARYFAARHHVRSDPGRPARWPMILTAAATAVAVAAVVAALRGRPVTWPWQPTAAGIPTACEALDTTGLLHRSAESRTRDRDLTLRHTSLTSSYCTEWAKPATLPAAPYLRIDVQIDQHRGTWRQSPIGAAIEAHASTRLGMSLTGPPTAPRTLRVTNADEAFTARWLGGIQVTARKGNLRVNVYVSGRGTDEANEHTARALAAGICDQLRLT